MRKPAQPTADEDHIAAQGVIDHVTRFGGMVHDEATSVAVWAIPPCAAFRGALLVRCHVSTNPFETVSIPFSICRRRRAISCDP